MALAVSRRTLAIIVLAASAAALGWLIFGGSDEERIRAQLIKLCDAVGTREGEALPFRTARLNGAFTELLQPDVTFDAPELERAQGIRQLSLLASSGPRLFGQFSVSLEQTEISLDQKAKQARATALVLLTGDGGGELRRDRRTVQFQLSKADGDWKVYGIQVAAKTDEQPEARP